MTPEPSWTRPADWLPLPAADNSFVGLVAVWENGFNSVALQCAGNYTVDWGDGTSDLIQSNTTAQHEYTYSGLTGTDCTRGYRQAVVVVTPQSGQVLSKVDLDQRHTSATTAVGASPWLDVAVSSASLTSLIFGSAVRFARNLEQATIGLHAVTDMSELFAGCYALQSVPLFDTSSVTTMQHMFDYCCALKTVPLFDTSSVADMVAMFNYCFSLQEVPLFDTSSVTSMSTMFYNCRALQSVPLFDTVNVLYMQSMFTNCYVLQSVPLFDTSAVTNMNLMFENCRVLQSVPLFDTSSVTTMMLMFDVCEALQSIPLFDTSSVTEMSSMFSGCDSLASGAMSGTTVDVSYESCNLSATELDRIYTNLGTVTGKTITVSGNPGTTGDTPSIATAKGWTVTGS